MQRKKKQLYIWSTTGEPTKFRLKDLKKKELKSIWVRVPQNLKIGKKVQGVGGRGQEKYGNETPFSMLEKGVVIIVSKSHAS